MNCPECGYPNADSPEVTNCGMCRALLRSRGTPVPAAAGEGAAAGAPEVPSSAPGLGRPDPPVAPPPPSPPPPSAPNPYAPTRPVTPVPGGRLGTHRYGTRGLPPALAPAAPLAPLAPVSAPASSAHPPSSAAGGSVPRGFTAKYGSTVKPPAAPGAGGAPVTPPPPGAPRGFVTTRQQLYRLGDAPADSAPRTTTPPPPSAGLPRALSGQTARRDRPLTLEAAAQVCPSAPHAPPPPRAPLPPLVLPPATGGAMPPGLHPPGSFKASGLIGMLTGSTMGAGWVFSVNHEGIRIPDCCACCLGPPEHLFPVTAVHQGVFRKTYSTWNFAYCTECMKHIRAHERAWLLGLAPGALVTCVLCWLLGFPAMNGALIALAVVVGAVIMVVVRSIVAAVGRGKGPVCACEGAAVGVHVSAFTGTTFTFSFRNGDFGRRFAELNG